MRSSQTDAQIPLEAVKPLDRLMAYREHCLERTRAVVQAGAVSRTHSPVTGSPLQPMGEVSGLAYGRCPDTGSLFLMRLADPLPWRNLLAEVNEIRHSPTGFHRELSEERCEHVHRRKMEWILETLRLQSLRRPAILEAGSGAGEMRLLLQDSGLFSQVLSVEEMELAHEPKDAQGAARERVGAALLMESLDRVDDPRGLLQGVFRRLEKGGLLFLTGLVASGFDFSVLGLKNLYLYPPDRTNCFTLSGLTRLLEQDGFSLIEVSTPGALDLQIVRAHAESHPGFPLSPFEQALLSLDEEGRSAFQQFLQKAGLSSFARLVARRTA